MKYEKGSFILVPNKSRIMGCEPYVQSVYLWICHYADDEGTCFPSRQTIAAHAGCSVKSVDRALEVLEDVGVLAKKPRRVDKRNLTNIYQIILFDGVPESLGGVRQTLGVASEGRTELNPVLTQSTYVVTDVTDEETPIKKRKDTAYLKVFELWGKYPLNWKTNTTEIAAAKNILEEHGLDEAKDALLFYKRHKGEEKCPQILKPSDLDRKWVNLEAHADRV